LAIYYLDVRYFSRRRGQSIVAAAAYRSGQRLYDHYYGESHDFTIKSGIDHSMILLPDNAPAEYSDRATLWNSVEYAEKRRDSRLAREVEAALPKELSLNENIRLVERYVIANFVDKGMIADVALHDKGDGNPHFHCLLTTRSVNENGFSNKNREWDKRKCLEQWRRTWAESQNRELERKGLESVSHESYAIQDFGRDIKRKPTIHRGYRLQKLARDGIETDRMIEYNEIVAHNRRERERQQERKRQRSRRRDR